LANLFITRDWLRPSQRRVTEAILVEIVDDIFLPLVRA
jgi:hypothetical protein